MIIQGIIAKSSVQLSNIGQTRNRESDKAEALSRRNSDIESDNSMASTNSRPQTTNFPFRVVSLSMSNIPINNQLRAQSRTTRHTCADGSRPGRRRTRVLPETRGAHVHSQAASLWVLGSEEIPGKRRLGGAGRE